MDKALFFSEPRVWRREAGITHVLEPAGGPQHRMGIQLGTTLRAQVAPQKGPLAIAQQSRGKASERTPAGLLEPSVRACRAGVGCGRRPAGGRGLQTASFCLRPWINSMTLKNPNQLNSVLCSKPAVAAQTFIPTVPPTLPTVTCTTALAASPPPRLPRSPGLWAPARGLLSAP